jgi:cytochrome c oxidase assembly protein subunit 15
MISVKYTISSLQKTALIILVIAVSIQFMLGVITLLYAVPIALGVAHQIGAFILLGSVVFALFQFKKPTSL